MQQHSNNSSTTHEKVRRRLVNLVFLIYWFVIFEGVLRKWVVPGLSTLIYFIEDPLVLAVYCLAWKYRMWPKWNAASSIGALVAIMYVLLAGMQIVAINANPLVTAYGLRLYFWYAPLAFLIGEHFRKDDLMRLVRQTLTVAIPIGLLVVVQFLSPPSSWINSYSDQALRPALIGDAPRTCGTFSYLTGQRNFVAIMDRLLVCAWILSPAKRPLPLPMLIVSSLSVAVSLMLNGSRAVIVDGVMATVAGIIGVLLMYGRGKFSQIMQKVSFMPAFLLTALLLVAVCFPRALEAQVERWVSSDDYENRIALVFGAANNTALIQDAPVGFGLGSGSSGGSAIGGAVAHGFELGEEEWGRIVGECGPSALFYIFWRLFLVGWLFVGAVKATRGSDDALPLLLVSFVAPVLAFGPIVMGGTPTYFAWLFAGFTMAASRVNKKAQSPKAAKGKRFSIRRVFSPG